MAKLDFKAEGLIVKKDLNVFVKVVKTDHEAVIDSLVRLSEVFVDTKSVRIRWAVNNKTEVVTLLSVKPMHSSQEDKKELQNPQNLMTNRHHSVRNPGSPLYRIPCIQ